MKQSLFYLLLMLLPVAAHAEGGCPPGQYPSNPTPQGGVMACYPMPTSGVTQGAGPAWETRWGAFATDSTTASLGVVTNLPSKSKAKKAAVAACKENGGKSCKFQLAFYNQCAAMVVGDKVMLFKGAATEEEAVSLTMGECQAQSSNCKVYQTACSPPERVR